MMFKESVKFVTIFLLMLITGVFWGTWFTLTRSLTEFSPSEFIHIGRVIIANVAIPMRIIMPVCILLSLLSVILSWNKNRISTLWGSISFILLIVTLLITLMVLVP